MDVVTWSVLELDEPARTCPWTAPGAWFVSAGATAPGRAGMPSGDGRWWSVLARYDDAATADAAEAAAGGLGQAWHVRLEPVAYRGDVVLAGGQTPFDDLPDTGAVRGPAAIVTFAGLGPDAAKLTEFLDRFGALADDLAGADGVLASAVLTPVAGPVLTFSSWTSLRAAMAWAYAGRLHAETIARQEEAAIVETAGFLRCRLVGSSGSLQGRDPLAALVAGMTRAAAVDGYVRAWQEPDDAARRRLLEGVWAEDGVYCDPQVHLADREALVAHIGGFQASAPGWRIDATSTPLEHHDAAYFRWALRDADGADVVTGLDVAVFDDEGRITRLTGFFDG